MVIFFLSLCSWWTTYLDILYINVSSISWTLRFSNSYSGLEQIFCITVIPSNLFPSPSQGQKNSRTMLLPLLRRFPDKVRVSLFHTPKLRGLLRHLIPERFNETIGLQHIKVYLFDDNVILSGWVPLYKEIALGHMEEFCGFQNPEERKKAIN